MIKKQAATKAFTTRERRVLMTVFTTFCAGLVAAMITVAATSRGDLEKAQGALVVVTTSAVLLVIMLVFVTYAFTRVAVFEESVENGDGDD